MCYYDIAKVNLQYIKVDGGLQVLKMIENGGFQAFPGGLKIDLITTNKYTFSEFMQTALRLIITTAYERIRYIARAIRFISGHPLPSVVYLVILFGF